MNTRRYRFRLTLVLLSFTVILTLITLRISYIQIFDYKRLQGFAQNQHLVAIPLDPIRGTVYDRNMRELATSLKVDSVYAVSRDVKAKQEAAEILAPILNKDEEFLYERLSRDKLFVWLARKISRERAQQIEGLNLKGIELIDETKRFYPNGTLASQTIGFAGTDNTGLEGIELYYDRYMRGRGGYKSFTRDAKGREVYSLGVDYIPPVNGYHVVLTIDEVVQHIAEKALKKACEKHNAKSGVCVVMDPYKGDIFAMAVWPSFDLNNFSEIDPALKRNKAICDTYEPGSVFKVVTASACLNEKVVSLEDNFFCENGAWYVAGHTLHDHRGHGNLNFREVIEKSSNIGTVKAAMKLGEEALYRYVKRYGFDMTTGIDLPGEVSGLLRPLRQWTRYSITAIPMGHEVSVTAIQMVCCVSAIANGGLLFRPRLADKIIDEDGQVIKEFNPVVKTRVIRGDTSEQLKSVMKGVVERGTGRRARLEKYDAAGKTGTSQKIEPSGRYSHSKYIASFIGFAPVERPVLSICVMIDEPHPAYFGGTVAAPVFKEVANEVLRYFEVEPETEKIIEARVRE